MRRYGLCRTTIYRWLRAANHGGPKALEPRPHRGRAPRVSAADAARIRSSLIDRTPREHGLPGDLWTRRTVCALVERQLHVVIHPVSASRLLGRLGLRPNGVAMPASEAAETRGSALAVAVDGRGAFLCTRLEARESVEARRHKLHELVRRAGRPTSVRVHPDSPAGRAPGA